MEYPGQRNGGDHLSRIDVAFVFSVEGFGETGGSKINRINYIIIGGDESRKWFHVCHPHYLNLIWHPNLTHIQRHS